MRFTVKIFLPLALGFVLLACKKDHNVLGVDVQPSVDELNAESIQGLPITAHTLPYDSVATFNDKYKYIGSNIDPFFGRTDVGLYLNTNITVSNIDFGANSAIQSAEIVLAVDPLEFVGDTSTILSYSVYPLLDKLSASQVYFTSDNRRHASTPISVSSGHFSIDNVSKKTVIRISIDPAYATLLLHDTPNLVNNEVFQNTYKGYYIKTGIANSSNGIIFKANLEDDVSGFFLHYKPNPAVDTVVNFRFNFFGTTASKYNTVKYDASAVIKSQFQDSTLGKDNLFLKGMGATRLKIQIPFLKNYSDSFQVAVNRAEVVLNVLPGFTGQGKYAAPPKLTLLAIDSLGRENYVKDVLAATDYSRYDGNYDESSNRYVFNIAREAQLIFGGLKKNYGFYVVVANTDISTKTEYATSISRELMPVRRDNYIERVVIAGSNNATLKPVFNLNYIKFKND